MPNVAILQKPNKCLRDFLSKTLSLGQPLLPAMPILEGNTFDKMITPNLVTFTVVLNACNHLGLLEKGQMYFEAMGNTYGIISTVEHLTCMVDLFSRAGIFDKAEEMIKKMESPSWISLLGSCKKWRNMEVGRWAFEHVVRLDETRALGLTYL